MKKRLVSCLCALCVCTVALYGCSSAREEAKEEWDCTVECMEESGEESYVITYSDEEVLSKSGTLTFQNRNKFDVTVHLLTAGKEERTAEIPAGGTATLYQLEKESVYTVGCHADVEEGTEIALMVYEGEHAETWS